MADDTTEAVTLVLQDLENGRLSSHEADAELLAMGISSAEASELIDISQGGSDLIEIE